MKFFLFLVFVLAGFTTLAQNCDCLDEFHFVKAHIEQNHGGFNKKIKSPDEPAYKAFTEKLEKDIRENKNEEYCIAYLKKYILYLQDHHSNISAAPGKTVKEDSAADVAAFLKSPAYLKTEFIGIDSARTMAELSKRVSGIEGIYQTADKAYTVGLIADKTKNRDYAAVIFDSKTPLWTKGQVKFELKQLNDSIFEEFVSLRNHSINYDQALFLNGQLQLNGWYRSGSTVNSGQALIDNSLIKFTVLDSSTTLLSIRSFGADVYKKLDSAYREVIPQIKKYRKLIIDVRNNGGGADQSYTTLMQLIYTNPFESDLVEYYSTPGNIRAYEDYDETLRKTAAARQDIFKGPVAKMKSTEPYSFVPVGNGKPVNVTYLKNDGYPLKVAILYNRYCASSCESLLFEAMNSKKTILVGENSGGFTGYGNVMTTSTPCGRQLSWTTTVYRNQWKYEFVGIPPNYRVPDNETDWVEYTKRLLK